MIDESPIITLTHHDDGRVRAVSVDGRQWEPQQIADGVEALAWQEKVCAIIQPAEDHDEWGMDVADIIAKRERERKGMLEKDYDYTEMQNIIHILLEGLDEAWQASPEGRAAVGRARSFLASLRSGAGVTEG